MKQIELNPEILKMVRVFRDMTQSDLSKIVSVPQPVISVWEASGAPQRIDLSLVDKLSIALRVPNSLLMLAVGSFTGKALFRYKVSNRLAELKFTEARLSLLQLLLSRYSADIEMLNSFISAPAKVSAQIARDLIGLGHGLPIDNMVKVLECFNVIAIPLKSCPKQFDAVTVWNLKGVPIVFYSEERPWDRIRLTLAHELGHVLMHSQHSAKSYDEIEKEAWGFAEEFLAPARMIESEFLNYNLKTALRHKSIWGMSMASLIRYALNLEQISTERFDLLKRKLQVAGFSKVEPNEPQTEFNHKYMNILFDCARNFEDSFESEFINDLISRGFDEK